MPGPLSPELLERNENAIAVELDALLRSGRRSRAVEQDADLIAKRALKRIAYESALDALRAPAMPVRFGAQQAEATETVITYLRRRFGSAIEGFIAGERFAADVRAKRREADALRERIGRALTSLAPAVDRLAELEKLVGDRGTALVDSMRQAIARGPRTVTDEEAKEPESDPRSQWRLDILYVVDTYVLLGDQHAAVTVPDLIAFEIALGLGGRAVVDGAAAAPKYENRCKDWQRFLKGRGISLNARYGVQTSSGGLSKRTGGKPPPRK